MKINSDCIYDTRPWVIYGEGPSVKNAGTAVDSAGNPPRGLGPTLTAADIRFTTKAGALYAVVMGVPAGGKVTIKSLAANSPHYPGDIGNIQQLGGPDKLVYTRDSTGLVVTVPVKATDNYAIALKISPKA
jgi:alpha-L-fucosidase